jgi:hypothetical protein
MTIALQDNSWEIRKAISQSGIKLCCCTEFEGAVLLTYTGANDMVHGLGYSDEVDGNRSVEEVIECFKLENKDVVYCQDVNEFINKIKKKQNETN